MATVIAMYMTNTLSCFWIASLDFQNTFTMPWWGGEQALVKYPAILVFRVPLVAHNE